MKLSDERTNGSGEEAGKKVEYAVRPSDVDSLNLREINSSLMCHERRFRCFPPSCVERENLCVVAHCKSQCQTH